ncbi:hypothetical protein EC973_000875 [Apophysomyces ossiformis]|uniref:Glycosyltransferase family 32 protein n=1 Tax=Apophysomyces ossiformis TaxID=679940 RepID=A0A8H7ESA5_9FUNG|nr:hypothetical protein EC973_000875 [Apophysomyces ossiformis]
MLGILGFLLVRLWISAASGLSNLEKSLSDFRELTIARRVDVKAAATSIPKIVHFVYGLRSPEPTLDLIHYLAIKSAHDVLKPEQIMFHYHYLPVGEQFEKARPMLTLRQVDLVHDIFGRPVKHYAHQADVIRLEVLQQYGGIYLDLDVISLKPIDHLLRYEFAMAQEGKGGAMGLCNAMILARPNARFLQRWYATYETFDSNDWNYHSVVLPGRLAPHFSDEITVLNHTAFFWPLWDGPGLRAAFLEKSYDYGMNYGTHIWESAAKRNLMKDIDEEVVMTIDNSLYCQLRRFLLDGQPDPRPNACRILAHTERADGLVGHWSLSDTGRRTNPMPAIDNSGNQLGGIIRNGKYEANDEKETAVHLSGRQSYIFLPMPTETTLEQITVSWWMKTMTDKDGGTAMVIQTEEAKVYAQTQQIRAYDKEKNSTPISLGLSTLIRGRNWEWQELDRVDASPIAINVDKAYHHYCLVIDRANITHGPPLTLYMDGYVISSNHAWTLPNLNNVVRGVWFGSSEPEHSNYQDPWDDTRSLEASYEEIKIWERSLNVDEVRKLTFRKPIVQYSDEEGMTTDQRMAEDSEDKQQTEKLESHNEQHHQSEVDIDFDADEDISWTEEDIDD